MPEETRIIAEFVGGVFLVYITFYLTKSHYEAKRQDDLADKDFSRRAVVHDRNIQKAREYIDKWESLLFIVNGINSKALRATNVDDMQKVLNLEDHNKSFLLLEELSKRASVLNIF